ncbi:MAG TPA: hypothetical protein VGK84_12435 [Candidatus Tumulicola sp.]
MSRFATSVFLLASLTLAACGGNQSQAITPAAVDGLGTARTAQTQSLVFISDAWFTTSGKINATGYSTNADGETAPVVALDAPGLEFESSGIAVSSKGAVALDGESSNGASVNVYPPGANGNMGPSAVYSCVGLGEAKALTFDKHDALYAMNFNPPRDGSNSIFVLPPNSESGCPSGTHTIVGKRTQLFETPDGIAVSKTHIYAMTGAVDTSAILVFPITANGDVRPSRIITGKKLGLQIPAGIAVDTKGEILVADSYTNSIVVFAANAKGDVAPIRVIKGSNTQLYLPQGVEVAKDGRIFVVNSSYNSNVQGDSITVYAADAKGNAKPIQTIPGGNNHPKSEIGNPTALALFEP